ncbi:MAG: carboxypeptidase regulatory-like domain-containing protein [Bryobacterales bacterium]|nr:carboxypeptidase regulatory-like domain-containing protein [Bryobacterales bacterium]
MACLLAVAGLSAQTTQGLIAGRVRDALDNRPVGDAAVLLESAAGGASFAARTDRGGAYSFPLLAPGTYHIRVSKPGYQSRSVHGLELRVAGFTGVDFELRPLDSLWERYVAQTVVLPNQSALSYPGPDLDPAYSGAFDPEPFQTGQLEPSVSGVVEPSWIATLPLTGRDVYTALAYMPGITSDTATGRSLGLSSNGQRPTSSNFLLDGLEDNHHFGGGPSLSVPPEAVQEYRVSTSSFSAEYGRTSGQVANAVIRPGGSRWHGLAYTNLRNDVLNANSFQANSRSVPKAPVRQAQAGATAGGPLIRERLDQFTALEWFRSRSLADPVPYALPSQAFLASLPEGSTGSRILSAHPLLPGLPGPSDGTAVSLRPTAGFDRRTALSRLQYQPSAGHRALLRVFAQDAGRPDFIWTPYGTADFRGSAIGAGINLVSSWTGRTTTEVRTGVQRDRMRWGYPLPGVPHLQILGETTFLPGASTGFGFADRAGSFELNGNILHVRGRSFLKTGGGFLSRSTRFALSRKPQYLFPDAEAFRQDTPFLLVAPLSRTEAAAGRNAPPGGGGDYKYRQYFGFLQETFRWTPRLTVNAGIRADSFGHPVLRSEGRDFRVNLGSGAGFAEQVRSATAGPAAGGAVFDSERWNWALRLGAAWAPRGDARTVVRAAYGMFYDRWFDSIWSSAAFNDLARGSASLSGPRDYLAPLQEVYGQLPPFRLSSFYNLTAFARPLGTPLVHSYFLGLQQAAGRDWRLEATVLGSAGRRLIANDIVNRQDPAADYERPNPTIREDINLRANQGYSDYAALLLSAGYRKRRSVLIASYAWSHSIDNQSDPLLGDFFDLGFANQTDRDFASHYYAGFSRQHDRESDRGNADFDQRHTFLATAYWTAPASRALVWRNWTFSGVYALRSGLPYTVFYGGNCVPVCNVRPDLVLERPLLERKRPAPGGELILDKAAFAEPAAGENGNLGRNSLRGAWFQNLDVSAARAFPIPKLGESTRFTLRADFYNVLNHANFNNPQAFLNAENFGIALKGRVARPGFPALTPLNESARQVEILLRLEF